MEGPALGEQSHSIPILCSYWALGSLLCANDLLVIIMGRAVSISGPGAGILASNR